MQNNWHNKTEVHQVQQLHTAENPIQIQKPTRKIILSLKFCSLFVVVSRPPASSPHHSPPYKSKTTNIMLIPKLLHTLKNILIIAAKLSLKKLFCECLHDKTKDSLWRHDNDSNLTNSSSILCCYIHSYEKYLHTSQHWLVIFGDGQFLLFKRTSSPTPNFKKMKLKEPSFLVQVFVKTFDRTSYGPEPDPVLPISKPPFPILYIKKIPGESNSQADVVLLTYI